jgi:hypothetical protein
MNCDFHLPVQMHRKTFPEEFNDCIQFIRDIKKEIFNENQTQAQLHQAQELKQNNWLKQALERLELLLKNDYFHFMFINNIVREIILI